MLSTIHHLPYKAVLNSLMAWTLQNRIWGHCPASAIECSTDADCTTWKTALRQDTKIPGPHTCPDGSHATSMQQMVQVFRGHCMGRIQACHGSDLTSRLTLAWKLHPILRAPPHLLSGPSQPNKRKRLLPSMTSQPCLLRNQQQVVQCLANPAKS